ncbi:uncharacterized protein LOC123442636 isoform X1 [Hordeum vulgare subsp. vulgare]|uniref:uncharacterized protein LOC123442636 isoform X1 n=1 Tax=Hordeum vulgare subsp. vulgare TaxID=112509 RepID=UPI001D1A3442|nr:uncharacterized protein LOC123442636 isoform X1 [Hordeum vulgare subsp. vulgare]
MSLFAAARRGAMGLISGARHASAPSSSVIHAAASLDAAHAHARRAWSDVFARATPSIGAAEAEIRAAQYFYELAAPSLARASASGASREGINLAVRAATSDLIEGSSSVLRASSMLRGATSNNLREAASNYFDAAAYMLRASETPGDNAICHFRASALSIGAAEAAFRAALVALSSDYPSPNSSGDDTDLIRIINTELESALKSDDHRKVDVILTDFPFKMCEKGCAGLTFTRTFHNEEIEVLVSVPDHYMSDTENENEKGENSPKATFALTVTVSKGNALSMFTCTAYPSEIGVNTLYMRLTAGEDEQEEYTLSFEGPESIQSLQMLSQKYLELRGVSFMNSIFLDQLMRNKGVVDRIFWLGKLKEFVRPSK